MEHRPSGKQRTFPCTRTCQSGPECEKKYVLGVFQSPTSPDTPRFAFLFRPFVKTGQSKAIGPKCENHSPRHPPCRTCMPLALYTAQSCPPCTINHGRFEMVTKRKGCMLTGTSISSIHACYSFAYQLMSVCFSVRTKNLETAVKHLCCQQKPASRRVCRNQVACMRSCSSLAALPGWTKEYEAGNRFVWVIETRS